MDSVQFVEMNPSLKAYVAENAIVEMIVSRIKAIPNYESLRPPNMDLALLLANLIETACYDCNLTKKTKAPNFKLEIGLKVLHKLDWSQPQDKDFFRNAISFLHSTKQIRKVPFHLRVWGKIKRFLGNFLKM